MRLWFTQKDLLQALTHLLPVFLCLTNAFRLRIDPERIEQQLVKLRLDGSNRDPLPVSTFKCPVKMGSAIKQIILTLVRPLSLLQKSIHHSHQVGRAIDHCRIDNLTLAGPSHFQ